MSGAIVNGWNGTYIRNGATNIFAAYNVSNGKVTVFFAENKGRAEFL